MNHSDKVIANFLTYKLKIQKLPDKMGCNPFFQPDNVASEVKNISTTPYFFIICKQNLKSQQL